MNKSQSKYFNTACLMDEALLSLLQKKDYTYITVKEICEKAGVNRSTFICIMRQWMTFFRKACLISFQNSK